MVSILQKDSGIGAAETGESHAQEERSARDGTASEAQYNIYTPMLDAMEGLVKRYYARPGYFNDSAGSHSNRYSSSLHNAF
jgi:hypothetical protein